jgi:hypothetical protein
MSTMRRGLWIIAAVAAGGAAARADTPRKKPAADEVDIQAVKSHMVLVHDGRGHYMAMVPFDSDAPLFYGDGKTFYLQRVVGHSQSQSDGTESFNYWSPTSLPRGGELSLRDGRWSVRCSDHTTPMVKLDETETSKLLARAVFKKWLWKRQAAALGRDDDGIYYYVDRIRDDRPGSETWADPHPPTGFRFFIGRKGKLREQSVTDTTIDSKGVVLISKSGNLVVDDSNKRLLFNKGKKREELVYLPIEDNVMLIYRDLGLYGRLGTPCDDL